MKTDEESAETQMNSGDVIDLYSRLRSLGGEIWLDGGWGVDALLGEQTRLHGDLDIVIQEKDLPILRKLLKAGAHFGPRGASLDDVTALCARFGIEYPEEYSHRKIP